MTENATLDISGADAVLVVTLQKNLKHANGKVYKCPTGCLIGVIVSKNDWENRDFAAVYGEAVYVNPKDYSVEFIKQDTGVPGTLFKGGQGLRVMADVKDDLVVWR